MTATPDPDSAEAARLLRAHELLDERPSPNVRAAVLRAAAAAAGSPGTRQAVRAPRPSTARRWLEWGPMAATAGVTAVAILAVGVAVHVDRETSSEVLAPATSTVPSASPAMAAPPSSPAGASAARSSPAAGSAATPSAAASSAARPSPAASATARPSPAAGATESSSAASPLPARSPAPSPAFDDMRVAPAAERRSLAPAPSPSATAPATAGSTGAAPAAQSRARDQFFEAKPEDQPVEAGPASLQAPAFGKVAPQVAQPMAPAAESALSNAVRSSRAKAGKEAAQPLPQADEWLRRIIELRRAGRDAQADDELARFRAAFPKVPVPAEAL